MTFWLRSHRHENLYGEPLSKGPEVAVTAPGVPIQNQLVKSQGKDIGIRKSFQGVSRKKETLQMRQPGKGIRIKGGYPTVGEVYFQEIWQSLKSLVPYA